MNSLMLTANARLKPDLHSRQGYSSIEGSRLEIGITVRNQILSSRQPSSALPKHITTMQSVHTWVDLMKSTDKLLLAGLARQVGAEKAKDAYRRWYTENCENRPHIARLACRLQEIQ